VGLEDGLTISPLSVFPQVKLCLSFQEFFVKGKNEQSQQTGRTGLLTRTKLTDNLIPKQFLWGPILPGGMSKNDPAGFRIS
jgi:hypothetical protein